MEAKQISLSAFLDKEGAFDKISFAAILTRLKENNLLLTQDTGSQLYLKPCRFPYPNESVAVFATSLIGAFLREGVLYSLLLSFIFDDLLNELGEAGFDRCR